MPNAPKALLFDLDGVLIDSYHLWFHLLRHTARALGYPEITHDAYRASWGQSTTADRDTFFPEHSVSDVEAVYDAHYFDYLSHLQVFEEVPGLFRELRERALPSAVVTNTQGSLARAIVQHVKATPEVIVGGNEVPRGKPAPDMLFRAMELLHVARADVWMIGDSRYDRDAAAAAAIVFVGVGIEGDHSVSRVGEVLDLLATDLRRAP